jgi:hypothetical protein
VNFTKLEERMKTVKSNMSDLEVFDKDEWYSIIFNKIRQLLNKYWNMQNLIAHKEVSVQELGELTCVIRESLYLLVYTCVTSESSHI